jgi:acyl-CoA oxidase
MPSLDEERNRSDVDIDKLGSVIYGGSSRIAHLKRIWKIIEDDEEFSKDSRAFFNHSQRYVDACRKIKRFQEIVDAEGLRSHDEIYDAYISIDESLPLDVHLSMFIPIMKLHTSAGKSWLIALPSGNTSSSVL